MAKLQQSFAALPDHAPIRLAKRTSNLFRARAEQGEGLDVSGLGGVIEIRGDVAQVQGMCTYEHLVAATLAQGRIPYVVPQLRTITLGGAVTGLGIESTSFRHGLPHESVREMDVFTGAGCLETVRPGDALFDAFPNSYGSLGYATRLEIDLEPVPSYVALEHVRFPDAHALCRAVDEIVTSGHWRGQRVDGLDGVAFSPDELYLSVARWTDAPGPTSDYTGQRIYYRSLQTQRYDRLSIHDYLWRWDTDWFWCSRAFGAQQPLVRRLWPRHLRRSDVYWKLVALDRRHQVGARLDRLRGRPESERVVQDVEVALERLPEFLTWFDAEIGMRPVWLCPLRLRRADQDQPWPGYPLRSGTTYVNVGFWGGVPVGAQAKDSPRNRAIEAQVAALGGHKSLYSEAFYDPDTFAQLYGTDNLASVRRAYDPEGRLNDLYDKVVRAR